MNTLYRSARYELTVLADTDVAPVITEQPIVFRGMNNIPDNALKKIIGLPKTEEIPESGVATINVREDGKTWWAEEIQFALLYATTSAVNTPARKGNEPIYDVLLAGIPYLPGNTRFSTHTMRATPGSYVDAIHAVWVRHDPSASPNERSGKLLSLIQQSSN